MKVNAEEFQVTTEAHCQAKYTHRRAGSREYYVCEVKKFLSIDSLGQWEIEIAPKRNNVRDTKDFQESFHFFL
ncbi:MAG: hypothetical protein ACPGJV_00105 [Bacteriovoracaceae bacterium]